MIYIFNKAIIILDVIRRKLVNIIIGFYHVLHVKGINIVKLSSTFGQELLTLKTGAPGF